jgi:glycosyltransferase involved in cell wall biosynthesis
MKVSIVTVSFNQAEFLERAILSVLNQTGVEVEYIVVDPGSSDGSRAIIERYRDHIAHIVFEKDRGAADGLNRGLALATGDIFGYLNSDDELVPGALAKAAAAFAAHPQFDVIYGNGRAVASDGTIIRPLISSAHYSARLAAYGYGVIIQQAGFCRTARLKSVGGFNPDNKTCWDHEAFLDMALAGAKFRRIWDVWGHFRIHEGSITGSGRLAEKYYGDLDRLFEKTMARRPRLSDKAIGAVLGVLLRLWDVRRLAVDLRRVMGGRR